MSRTKRLEAGFAGVVTGASTGIGRALAVLFAERFNARLVLSARTASTLQETAELVVKAGGVAEIVIGDIADRELASSLPGLCLAKYGALDLLVNNAGLAVPGPVPELTPDDWHRVFDVNFFAALHATYAAMPHFIERQAGKIVNIASIAGKVAFPGSVCYAASKFALTGMSEGMGAELADQGIDVVTVCPGWVRSEFFEKNQVADYKNPTLIARKNDFSGWLMRSCLSISSEECAEDILRACQKGGPQEIVLTGPGLFAERFHALFPGLARALASRIPAGR